MASHDQGRDKDRGERQGDEPRDKQREKQDEKVMPFLHHLEELRRVLFRLLIATAVGTGIAWAFSRRILDWLIASTSGEAVFLKPQGAFMARIKVAIVLGILVVLPYLFYQIWSFVGPGLLSRERKVVLPGAVASVILFYMGIAFSYFVLTPLAVQVLMSYGTETLRPQTEIQYLLDLVFMFALASGLVFQMPLFAAFLTGIRLLSSRHMKTYWRHAIVGIFILAAILTPTPDILSQLLLAGPLLILYVVSYGISWGIERVRRKSEIRREEAGHAARG